MIISIFVDKWKNPISSYYKTFTKYKIEGEKKKDLEKVYLPKSRPFKIQNMIRMYIIIAPI